MAAAHSVLAVVLLFTVYGAAPDDIITSQSVFYLYWFPKQKKKTESIAETSRARALFQDL